MENNIQNTDRFRGFKVETIQATNTKPNRIKIIDLRYSKTVILNYGAKCDTLAQVVESFFDSKGIKLIGQLWAEDKNSIHLYGIYLTSNFNIQIN